jgi:hypothetical protein
LLFCFVFCNSESGRATIAAKYEKDKKFNMEDIALLKKTRSHISSQKFKKKNKVLKDLSWAV